MNYRRWILVGFVAALAIFSFWHLTSAGTDYQVMTTSDSGFFYGVAEDINQQDGFIDKYDLSHPPMGKAVGKKNQFQSLMLVTLYRGLHSADSSISLLDVSMYFSPLLFAFAVIGAFLAAREIGGDIAGCGSALFFTTMVGSIYWTKIGALDREITLIFFSVWIFYLLAKVFKTSGKEMLKYSVFAGLLYGIFMITWSGAMFLGPIIVGAVILVALERSVSGLGLLGSGVILILVGSGFSGFDVAELMAILFILVGIGRMSLSWEELEDIENRLFSSIRSNLHLAGAAMVLIGVTSVVVIVFGGYSPDFWVGLLEQNVSGFLGIGGGGGASFPTYATEMQAAPSAPGNFLNALDGQLFRDSVLTGLTVAFVSVGVLKAFWTHKNWEFMALAWLIVVVPMPLAQARFFRLFWPIWPILAGFGLGAIYWVLKRFLLSSKFMSSDWVGKLRRPLVLALVGVLFIAPFIQNVRADSNASSFNPAPHGASLPGNQYSDLVSCFDWVKENTAENAVLGIRWSYGHFATGYTNRASVTDGAQVKGWRGEWQDSSGIKPPDYIQYVSDGKGYIIGINASLRDGQINGRRPDVGSLQEVDEDDFSEILGLYEEYGVNPGYFIFDHRFEASALYGNLENMREPENISSTQGGWSVYKYENEMAYLTNNGAFIRTEDNSLRRVGLLVVYLSKTSSGSIRVANIKDIEGFDPTVLEHQTMVLQYKYSGFESPGYVMTEEGHLYAQLGDQVIPVITKVAYNYDLPSYLQTEFISPNGHFSVAKIDHDEIP